ncbi:riboflavin synthase [Pullulanibacillus sp. KACC 23026]|uniref:riboflavin synthase n=1 Tax=Pullulanibacillus sp. KACC 23026 TaxID=3028315 RepID=UPI0023B015D3|nr:riboflavin synthase [Pullulanibacillus sp. KACC 23026]WEG12101.1 riboflavin synthase [Pullulanibacillus sp. KACC 23026]
MFTGIIEEIGQIESIQTGSQVYTLTIGAKKVLQDVKLGDSMAVNGVCLTVTSFRSNEFTVDVMPETVKATTIRTLSRGSKVNLERAMGANGRFGGHFVAGHVDGVGQIKKKVASNNAIYYEIEVEPSLLSYMVLKGSVTVDGTSLTLFGLTDATFTISLIPHTLQESIIGEKEPGQFVNVETDMLAKYLYKFSEMGKAQQPTNTSSITPAFLTDHGYM